MLYDDLQKNYALNEPILISEIKLDGVSMNNIRQQVKRLVDSGKLKRFDTGIYYLPAPSLFKSGTAPSIVKVIDCKYPKLYIKYKIGPFCSKISLYGTKPCMILFPTVKKAFASHQSLKVYKKEFLLVNKSIENATIRQNN